MLIGSFADIIVYLPKHALIGEYLIKHALISVYLLSMQT